MFFIFGYLGILTILFSIFLLVLYCKVEYIVFIET